MEVRVDRRAVALVTDAGWNSMDMGLPAHVQDFVYI